MAFRVCSVHGCPELFEAGSKSRCPAHEAAADAARGSTRQRGYDREHEQRFRPGVLAKDPVCVIDGCAAASVVADHYPRSRRELVALRLDPNDPRYGRGLCLAHHSSETARHQPGGWHRRG